MAGHSSLAVKETSARGSVQLPKTLVISTLSGVISIVTLFITLVPKSHDPLQAPKSPKAPQHLKT